MLNNTSKKEVEVIFAINIVDKAIASVKKK